MNGLVLAGGHSRRMGQPKSLLHYHGKPQYQHTAELLSIYCDQVFISCRSDQQNLFEGCYIMLDSAIYGDIGPLNGLLSAFDHHPNSAWLVLGCDYPLLQPSDLEQLILTRNPNAVATVFFNAEAHFPEPLLGIYEVSAGPSLHDWLRLGNESLRRFLEKHAAQYVIPQNPACLKSVDTPEEMRRII